MAYVIALAGKGGTGKTTIAALTVRYLIEKKQKPVLAVDADSNACLNEALGVPVYSTIGNMREEALATVRSGADRPGGMSMEQMFDYHIQQALIESSGFDLLVMGRPEGPGCYCAANNIIRKYSDQLSEKYPYVVIDNEAGMEHLSRRTTHKVDLLIAVSDPTLKGVSTAKRISELIDELDLDIDRRILIINRSSAGNLEKLSERIKDHKFEAITSMPSDEMVSEYDLEGKPVFSLPAGSKALSSLFDLLDTLNMP